VLGHVERENRLGLSGLCGRKNGRKRKGEWAGWIVAMWATW
jgi:hypothetical protein